MSTTTITEENKQENPDETSSKLTNNDDQTAAPRPDDVILSIEEETQAGSSESISNKDQASNSASNSDSDSDDQTATDSRCSQIKASISTCFTCKPEQWNERGDNIPGSGSLCWYLGQCCKNFCLMFFCGVCCLFKSSAREKAFTGVHFAEEDEDREDQEYKKYIKRKTYLGQFKENFMHFTEKLLQLTKSPVESEDERYFRLKSSLCS